MKSLTTRATRVFACALVLAAVAVAVCATGRGATAAAEGVTGETSPLLLIDDRWSYYGGRDDAAAFSQAITAQGAAAEPDVQYVWGRWESCLSCGEQGAAAFAKPGTMLMKVRDGEVVAVTVCCGSTTIKLEPVGETTITALSR